MNRFTYCNPLSIPDIPSGRFLDAEQTNRDPREFADYRSISDPSVVYHDGKWILYPSYSLAYVTEDFMNWEKVDIGIPHLRYSPAVTEFRGKWYLNGHTLSELYVADLPTGPFRLLGHMTTVDGKRIYPPDGCFLADGDRLYFYYHSSVDPKGADVEYMTATLGVEMDPERPWQMLTEPVEINRFEPEKVWQRMGAHNQNKRMGWIEGQWVKKIGKRYYLLYSGAGTELPSYANGVCFSDEGPLTGFRDQIKNPLTRKTTGLVRGAGHGCLVDGPDGSLWVFYTNIFCYNHMYERRISMDRVWIDQSGELYCPDLTENPRFAPGQENAGEDTGWLDLAQFQRPTATSHACGRDAIYASEDSILSWWQPASEDPEPAITFSFGGASHYHIHALRLIWRDIGMETLNGVMPGPFRYLVEYAIDPALTEWRTLVDASGGEKDLCVDYRECDGPNAYGVRLRILGAPDGIKPGLVSLSAFGNQ
ncbi:MAG: family 43 glycosylhydrolase [Clostridia bacterium]|nr:family 43 glycosylhydrolase [Clostridia bacterium]